jgi:AcrR family transcriptional regulator
MSVSDPTSDGRDTKERLLDAAERLFGEQGFESTSLRQITTEAGANLAAVNYHFGSKEDLIVAVMARRVEPLNRERLRLLDRLEAGETPPTVEQVLETFLAPPLRMKYAAGEAGTAFMRLTGHAMFQSNERIRHQLMDQFQEVARRYLDALTRAAPHAPVEETIWRLLFSVGAMVHALVMSEDARVHTWKQIDPDDVDALIDRMVRFLSAGFMAPAARPAEGGEA